jgi:hypothetical protein
LFVTNIENAITTAGECLALINFDQDLLRLIEPLIEMKHEAVVNKQAALQEAHFQ